MDRLIITIDGPAGSGKSTIARKLAEKLHITYLDTGAMYRAITLVATKAGFNLADTEVMLAVLANNNFEFVCKKGQMKTLINNVDVSEQIRLPEVTREVHHIASNSQLREKLVEMQRNFAYQQPGIITEGRDQGTVAFPYADFKFFLTAKPAQRAKRRQDQLLKQGIKKDYGEILDAIKERDFKDANRDAGPLKPADEARIIDTTDLSIDQVIEEIICQIKSQKHK